MTCDIGCLFSLMAFRLSCPCHSDKCLSRKVWCSSKGLFTAAPHGMKKTVNQPEQGHSLSRKAIITCLSSVSQLRNVICSLLSLSLSLSLGLSLCLFVSLFLSLPYLLLYSPLTHIPSLS